MEQNIPKQEIKTHTKDGVIMGVGSIPTAEKMFFYERSNGTTFNVSEQDAARIHTKFKFIGHSDGVQYANAIKDLQAKFQELTKQEIRQGMLDAWQRELEIARVNTTPPILKPLNMNIKEQVFLNRIKDEIK